MWSDTDTPRHVAALRVPARIKQAGKMQKNKSGGQMLHIHTPTPNTVDYDAIVAVRNTVWSDEPTTVEQLRHFDATWPATYLSQRLLVEVDGSMVAAGHYFEIICSTSRANMTLTSSSIRPTRGGGISAWPSTTM